MYDRERDLLPLVTVMAKRPMECGKGTMEGYDYQGIEQVRVYFMAWKADAKIGGSRLLMSSDPSRHWRGGS